MRAHAPEMAARYRDGHVAEGAHVVDAGQVGTEMLYSSSARASSTAALMCTASHNPKAYTGVKLVREGAIALSGDAGHPGHPQADRGGPRRAAPGGGAVEEVDIYEDFQAAALKLIDAATSSRCKVVVDGGNGMAGPMVGPLLDELRLDLVTSTTG